MVDLNHFDVTCNFVSLCRRVLFSFCFFCSFCTLESCTVGSGQFDSMTFSRSFTAVSELAPINKRQIN